MVERESVERKAPQERRVRIIGETTFTGLGIESPLDNLNLASDKLTLAVGMGRRPSSTVNLVFDHHPFAGEHFAQLLGIAPSGSGGRLGILADLNMPVNAKSQLEEGVEKSENIRLHIRHLNDPRIGPSYKRFVDQNLESWRKALENDASWEIFEELQRVTFIESLQDFTTQVLQKWKEMPWGNDYSLPVTAFSYYQKGKRFTSFLKDKIKIHLSKYGREEEWAYHRLASEQKAMILHEFIEQLSPEEIEAFALAYIVDGNRRVLVDLNSREVSRSMDAATSTKVDFVEQECVRIRDDKGTIVEAIPYRDIGLGRFDWKARHYEFSPQYLSTSLYPTIAWERNENGSRRFLTQREARPYLRQLGIPEANKGDVKIGEIMAAYFSSNVTGNWKKKMPLKPMGRERYGFEQSMMGAQLPLWVAVEHHGAELLSDNNPFSGKIEDRINSAL